MLKTLIYLFSLKKSNIFHTMRIFLTIFINFWMTLEPLVQLLVLWNKDLWYKKKFFHLIYIHSVIMMSLQKPMMSSYLIIVMGRIMSCSKYGFLETSLCWSIAVRIYRIQYNFQMEWFKIEFFQV